MTTTADKTITLDVWDVSNLCAYCDFNEDGIYEELMTSVKNGTGGEWYLQHNDEDDDSFMDGLDELDVELHPLDFVWDNIFHGCESEPKNEIGTQAFYEEINEQYFHNERKWNVFMDVVRALGFDTNHWSEEESQYGPLYKRIKAQLA